MVSPKRVKNILPQAILDELFCPSKIINDVVLDYICSFIEDHKYNVTQIHNNDLAITIIFNNSMTDGELRIDRLAKLFELSVRHNNWTYIPVSGNWEIILKCFNELNNIGK